jgi:hypothetical protein
MLEVETWIEAEMHRLDPEAYPEAHSDAHTEARPQANPAASGH